MTAPRVRADYDQLKQTAQAFGGQAEATQKVLQALQRDLEVLQGGDWLGKGATAFYQEMGSQVMPTMKRLANALQTAQQTTLQIQQIVKQAEDEAARWLRGDGSGAGAGVVPGPGPGGGSGSGSGGAGGGSAGGGGAGAATAAQQAAAVDRKLSAFSQGTRDLVKKSPTLRRQILEAEQKGYSFRTGAAADGYYTNPDTKTIVIDQPLSDKETVQHLAHEVGHAVTLQTNVIQPTPTTTRDQFVQQNVANLMHNEGEAQFNAAQIRAELKAAGAGDIGIPGSQTAAYQQVYDDFTAGRITKAQAIDRMGNLMGNETQSRPPHKRYREGYADAYRKYWDENIAPTRTTP